MWEPRRYRPAPGGPSHRCRPAGAPQLARTCRTDDTAAAADDASGSAAGTGTERGASSIDADAAGHGTAPGGAAHSRSGRGSVIGTLIGALLAGILGGVRDGDVLLERIQRAAARLPESSRPGADRVIGALAVTREDARDELLEALRSERYLELLDLLIATANSPALRGAAEFRARAALPALVREPWRLLEKRADALGKSPPDEALHDIRVRTKRVRYAAEAVAPVVGKRARAFATAAADLQDVLGDLNDAVVAESRLRDWARGHRSTSGYFARRARAAPRWPGAGCRTDWPPCRNPTGWTSAPFAMRSACARSPRCGARHPRAQSARSGAQTLTR